MAALGSRRHRGPSRRPAAAALAGTAAVAGSVVVAGVSLGWLVAATAGEPRVAVAAGGVLALAVAALVLRPHRPGPAAAATRDPVLVVGSLALYVALVTITWNGVRFTRGVTVSDAFLVIAGVCFLGSRLSGHAAAPTVPRWVVGPALAFVALALLTVEFAGASLGSLGPALRLVVAFGLTPLVIGALASTGGALWIAIDAWLLSIAINALVAVSDYFAGTGFGFRLTSVETVERATGLTTQENHLAVAAVMAMPVIIARILYARTTQTRAYFAGLGLLTATALIASGSRGGLVAGALALLAAPLLLPTAREKAFVFMTGTVVCLGLLGALVSSQASLIGVERLTGGADAQVGIVQSDGERRAVAEDALAEFRANPVLGVGFERVRRAHSVYLQLLSAGGVLALVAFLTFSGGAIRAALTVGRSPTADARLRALGLALAVSMGLWLLLGVVENQIFDRYLLVPAGFIVALAAVHRRESEPAAA